MAAPTATRLIGVDELGESGVAVVATPHGDLAVGLSGGAPFAVSNRCRHLFASLGEGRVTDDGRLGCPWRALRRAQRQDDARPAGRVSPGRRGRQEHDRGQLHSRHTQSNSAAGPLAHRLILG